MSVSVSIFSNTASVTRAVSVSFEGDILAGSNAASVTTDLDYFFKFISSAKSTDGIPLGVELNMGLNEPVLNGVKQSQTDTSNAYSTVSEMVTDFVYDYVYGHVADQFGSGVTEQNPMDF